MTPPSRSSGTPFAEPNATPRAGRQNARIRQALLARPNDQLPISPKVAVGITSPLFLGSLQPVACTLSLCSWLAHAFPRITGPILPLAVIQHNRRAVLTPGGWRIELTGFRLTKIVARQ